MAIVAVSGVGYAFRRLRRSPGFAITAVLALALGIGVNTAIFSTVNTLLLRPYSFPYLDRMVVLREGSTRQPGEQRVAPADFLDWQSQSKSFDQLAGFRFSAFNMSAEEGEAGAVEGYNFTPNLFPMIGTTPLMGRTFLPEEGQDGKNLVAVISHNTWRERFGSAPDILGKTVVINGTSLGVKASGIQISTPSG